MACADSGHCQSEDPGGRDAAGPLDGWRPEHSGHAGFSGQSGQGDQPEDAAGYETPRPHGAELGSEFSVLSQIVAGLREGRLSPRQAAERLEAYRDGLERPAAETTTETVRDLDGSEGRVRLERGTPENDEDRPGERTASDESAQLSHRDRQVNVMVRATGAILPNAEKFANNVQAGLTAYWPDSVAPPGETGSGQETSRADDQPSTDLEAGDAMSATLTAIVATVVLGQRAAAKLHSPRKPRTPRRGQDDGDPGPGGGPARPTGR